jgi:hypothetical protein
MECSLLFSFLDAINPRLAFVEFLNNLEGYYISDAVEK